MVSSVFGRNFNGGVRADYGALCTPGTAFRGCRFRDIVAFAVESSGHLEHRFRAGLYTQLAPLAALLVDLNAKLPHNRLAYPYGPGYPMTK